VKYNLEDMSRAELENAIDEWILNERDRKILKRRLLDGIIFESLSYEFDLSVRHIKTIVYKGEDRLFSKISKMH
jgi:hypothetical protein